MLTKIELLALLQNNNIVTAYFISDVAKMLLAKEFRTWNFIKNDSIEGLDNLLLLLNAKPLIVELNAYDSMASISFLTQSKTLAKLNVYPQTAIIYAQQKGIHMFVHQSVLQKEGIYITAELIEEILQC